MFSSENHDLCVPKAAVQLQADSHTMSEELCRRVPEPLEDAAFKAQMLLCADAVRACNSSRRPCICRLHSSWSSFNIIVLQDFYGNMSQNIAMMTLFDTDRYYNEAASSTTIVAMSTSTPLIVEPGFAEVYSHIGAGGFLEAKNGDYAAAIAKVLQMTAEEWENLAMEVRCHCQ